MKNEERNLLKEFQKNKVQKKQYKIKDEGLSILVMKILIISVVKKIQKTMKQKKKNVYRINLANNGYADE